MNKWKVAIIDDDQRNYEILENVLIKEFDLLRVSHDQMIEQLVGFRPDLVLIRAEYKAADAYLLSSQIKDHISTRTTPIILISRRRIDYDKALSIGICDVVSLFDPSHFLISRIKAHMFAASQDKACMTYLEASKIEHANNLAALMKVFAKLIEYKDYPEDDHVFRVGRYVYMMAKVLDYKEEDATSLMRASYFHDIGKLILKDELLLKEGTLTYNEWQEMTEHTTIMEHMIAGNADFMRLIKNIATQHHEKYNGEGYPKGLSGDKISLEAKIVSLCEVFDALTHDRHHRKAWEYGRVIDYIRSESGQSFDPALVEVFLNNLDKFINIKHNTI